MRKIKSIQLPYHWQLYIAGKCRCLSYEPEKTQKLILDLIRDIGGEDADCLAAVLLDGKYIEYEARARFAPPKRIYRKRKQFYEELAKIIKKQSG